MSTINLLNMEKFAAAANEVTSTEIWISKGTFHPDGLFSESIFGAIETPERNKLFGYISLNTKVVHPALFPTLKRIERKLIDAINREGKFTITPEGYLEKDPEGEIYGLRSVLDNFDKINFRGGTDARDNIVKMFNHYKKKNLFFIDKVPVMPPNYRDIKEDASGGKNIEPPNDKYQEILRVSLQLKTSPIGVVFDVLSTNMQQLALDLYDFISNKISRKEGLIRHDVLGKRVDYTARAVITGAGYDLKSDELGLPLRVLVKIFEPFIIYQLLNSGNTPREVLAGEIYEYNQSELSSNSVRDLLASLYKGDELPDSLLEIIKAAVQRAIADKVVIAKRDPCLHTESTMGFKPILVEGNTIKLNTLLCSGFTADFDGDQMAVFTPVTQEAIDEVRTKMITVERKDGISKFNLDFSKDTKAGLYLLTMEPKGKATSYGSISDEKTLGDDNIYRRVNYRQQQTTVGRVIFNKSLPAGYPFVNEAVTKKVFSNILDTVFRKYSQAQFRTTCDDLHKLGCEYYTFCAPTFSMDDLEIPPQLHKLKAELAKLTKDDATEAQKIIDQMERVLEDYMVKKGLSVGVFTEAGATKGIGNMRQILVCKGLIADVEGNVLDPITAAYADGTTAKEFFSMGPGNRKGIVNRVINTATTGYLARQLIYALQSVEVQTIKRDCGTKRLLSLTITEDIVDRLEGRWVLDTSGKFRKFDPKKDIRTTVQLRSPILCTSKALCPTCYGELAYRNTSPYVGITAAQIIGERSTQMIMKAFHAGGAVSVDILNLVNEATNNFDKDQQAMFIKKFKAGDNSLIALDSGYMVLKTRDFLEPKTDVKLSNDNIWVAYGYFYIKLGQYEFDITFDYETTIALTHGYEVEKDPIDGSPVYVIPFKASDHIAVCVPKPADFTKKVKITEAILCGRKAFKNEAHFLRKIFDQYSELGTDADLVHFEVLVSNLLRDSTNPRIPARLNTKNYKPLVDNIKKIPVYESWLSSLAFEKFNQSIETGLIYERPSEESIMEKMITGNL